MVIYDPDVLGDAAKELVTKENCIGLPFARMAEELGQPRIMANAVAAGAVWALLSEEITVLHETLALMFADKGEAVVAGNQQVASHGFERVRGCWGQGPDRPNRPRAGRTWFCGVMTPCPWGLGCRGEVYERLPHDPSTGVTEFIASYGRKPRSSWSRRKMK